jgi:hypothetical protein
MKGFFSSDAICIPAKNREVLMTSFAEGSSAEDEKTGFTKITVDSKTLLDYSLGT